MTGKKRVIRKWKPPVRKSFIPCRIQENKRVNFQFPHPYCIARIGCSLFAKVKWPVVKFSQYRVLPGMGIRATFFASQSALLFLWIILELPFDAHGSEWLLLVSVFESLLWDVKSQPHILTYFELEDSCFTILCWFLPYNNVNPPWIYICPLMF